MKKLFSVIIISLVAISTAQTASAQKLFSFGPRVGMNTSFNLSKGTVSTLGEAGWKFGATVEVRPIKIIGVSLDVMYSSQGFKREYEGGNMNYNLGYLEIPILLNVYVWKGLSLKAGIQPAIKLNGRIGVSGIENPEFTEQMKNNIKAGKFGIPVGVGYTFGFGLSVDARYNIGVTNISEGTHYSGDTFEVGVAWKF